MIYMMHMVRFGVGPALSVLLTFILLFSQDFRPQVPPLGGHIEFMDVARGDKPSKLSERSP
ncbi:hypothetical protein CAFE_18760 [Caprobacter fermentans]|uniref:Uncharacterized protein n=1 Tax=Caproicibacter fermentans TaxID=2576756 RepID=A0A6N8HZU2_9FIRM|nr:hypothetical protein [Caproicibacter fermentans]MVB11168.1 hypothetical protein [Caproicibacter fermentans]